MTRRSVLNVWVIVALVAGLASYLAVARSSASTVVRPGVTLRVNLERKLVITPGTPLQIEVSLTNAPNAPRLRIGGWWRPWHEYVRLEDPVTGRAAPWSLSVVSATSAVLEPGPEGSHVMFTTGRVAYMERGRQVHTVTFVAAPATTAQAPAGVYRLRAVVEAPRWQIWGWRSRAVSSPATITVRARDAGAEGVEVLEQQRLKYAAKYYLSTGQPDEARRMAEELLALRTNDPATLILLGDISVAQNQRERALAEYRRAMALLPPSREEPVLLQRRIDALIRDPSARGDSQGSGG